MCRKTYRKSQKFSPLWKKGKIYKMNLHLHLNVEPSYMTIWVTGPLKREQALQRHNWLNKIPLSRYDKNTFLNWITPGYLKAHWKFRHWYLRHTVRKGLLCHRRTATAQISLRRRAIWLGHFLFVTLRKQAYSNILKILPRKKRKFSGKKFYFS